MPYNLFLLRHAKSDWSIPGQKDFDRELNIRGNNDAPRMGRKLSEMQMLPERILCSPALRTKLTAEYVCEQLKFDLDKVEFVEDIYEASLRTLLGIVNGLEDNYKKVMLIGHNPGFTYLAEYLTKTEIGNIPTCGFVNLEFEIGSWKEVSGGLATLKDFIYPKML